MSRKTRILAGTLGILLLALLVLALFLRYQIRKSFPVTSGSVRVPGLEAPARVFRDGYGVPTVEAGNEHDLMFAVGYVHAQDRLWQMDIARRAAEGRLSELFGTASLAFDRMFRVIGLGRTAESITAALPPESRMRLQAYADGVNAFIAGAKGKYPVEFDLLGYQPEEWSPLHSVMIGRLMAWELNLSWWTDLTYGMIAECVGLERTLELIPGFPAEVRPTVPEDEWRRYASLTLPYLRTAQAYAAQFGTASIFGGSNAWAVAPRRSTTGNAMLANDTHLQLASPSRWYELQMEMPGMHVRGMSIPGVPAVLSGRNDSIAWGITNVMADDADFYVERLDSATATQYWYDGHWQAVTLLNEEIAVRGDTVHPLVIRLTRHGPIVTDVAPAVQLAHPTFSASMRWTGNEIDDQFGAFMKIDRARNWTEFASGVRDFAVPGQNFVYADVRGHIGYWCGVKLPIRPGRSSLLPLPGWDPGTEWRGYVPFGALPHRFDPPEGFIASANNKIVDDSYPYHITDLWEPSSRIQRLDDVLGKEGEAFSLKDFERLQNDSYSSYARGLMPYVFNAFHDSVQNLPDGERVFEYLRNWHYQFMPDDIATAIYQQFLVRLIHNTFADEMGEALYHDWVILGNIPLRVLARVVRDSTSAWFDDVRTPEVETRDEIIRRSLREALTELHARFGDDMKLWRWGDMHTVTLRHLLGVRKPLDRIFNLGPYPIGGGPTALVSGEFDFNQPFEVTVGPSFRQIFDLGPEGELRTVLPSGQSGQVFHVHYGDQTRLWLNGGYRAAEFAAPAPRGAEELTLEPSR
ncbi:MAG TPA: penicillin acylase family protein [Bacteroidota bacterium]|nr:penicillin acylase family protein [Bacteroidota bacterium]